MRSAGGGGSWSSPAPAPVPYAPAVDLHLIHAEGGHRQHGTAPPLIEGELAAEVRAGFRLTRRGRAGRGDEPRRPVARLQQRRVDVERLAPVARHPVGAGDPDAMLPVLLSAALLAGGIALAVAAAPVRIGSDDAPASAETGR